MTVHVPGPPSWLRRGGAVCTSCAGIPRDSKIRRALEDAMEIALENVPAIDGRVVVCPDVSGSMRSPVTSVRRGGTTAVRCVDVAALVAAAVLRRNPEVEVLPYEQSVVDLPLSARDSVMTNAAALARIGGAAPTSARRWPG